MKKITLTIAAIAAAFTMNAQSDVLSHSVDNTMIESGSVACASNPDQVPGNGDEFTNDNVYYRAYTPSDFGYSGDFNIEGSNYFITFTDIAGNDPTIDYTVRFFTSSDVFPAGTLTEIGSIAMQATAADNGILMEARLDTPITVSSSTEIIVAIDTPGSAAPNQFDFRAGINGEGQNDESFLSSTNCGGIDPTAAEDLGNFPDNNLVLDLVGNGTLSVADVTENTFNHYLNNNILTVESNSSIDNVTIFNILGQQVATQKVAAQDAQVNVGSFKPGVYLAQVKVEGKVKTFKFIKK